ncbi:MAG: methionine biosynthesis protein MetW, partial [Proteobacteria bacterium]|nr:methionine biosynthesis protein MetW [Pseudomonadota bacterium]
MDRKEKLTRKNAFDGSLQMGIRTFMAQTGRDDHLQHVERRREFFRDSKTGDLKAHMAAPRSCPLCGKDDPEKIFRKHGFWHVECRPCGFMYVSPVAKDEVVEEFYRQEKSWATVLENPTQLEFDRKKFAYGLDVALEYCPSRPRVLDVGCGPGVFIDVARERGFEAAGVELNQQNVADMRARGITVYDRSLDQCGL